MENTPVSALRGDSADPSIGDRYAGLHDLPVEEQPVYMDLVVACATTDLHALRVEMVRRLALNVADWQHLLRLAAFHGVSPLIAKALTSSGISDIHAPLLPNLGRVGRDVAVRNLALASEQKRIVDAFHAHGIPGIPFKGPVLAQMAYRNLGLRACTDIDVLIPAGKYADAETVLLSNGFRLIGRAGELEGVSRSLYRTLSRQCAFARGPVALDLHVGIMPPGYRFEFTFDELMGRTAEVSVGGIELRTFSPEDMLIILCFHGVKNRWEALKHFCDIAELLRSHPGLDWNAVTDRAKRTRATRIVRLGVHMASKLLDAPLPDNIASWSEQDEQVKGLTSRLLVNVATTHRQRMDSDERFRFHLAVQDTLATKARYFAYALARRAQRSAAWVPED